MKEYSTIIWDFNGTIIDDVMASLQAVNDMLTYRGQKMIDIKTYYSAVDVPIWKFYERVFEAGSITPQQAMVEYDEAYERHLQKNPLMEGIVDVLRYFRARGKKQIVVSASHVDKVTGRLHDLGIFRYFTCVLAHSDYNAGDKTYLAQKFLNDNKINAEDVVVIGDCVFDYQMAAALGCDCILNTRGHQSRREYSGIPVEVIDYLDELRSIIK